MNSVAEDNQKTIEYLLNKNKRLKGLNFKNNTLSYKDQSVVLNELNIKTLIMQNKYDRLAIDLNEDKIDAQDLFNIIKINTFKIQEEDNNQNNLLNYALEFLNKDLKEDNIEYDIISTSHYFNLAKKKNALKNIDLARVNKYEIFIGELMQYIYPNDNDDYLIPTQRTLLINYLTKCKELIKNNTENDITIKYQDLLKQADNNKLKAIKKQDAIQNKAGFTSAIIVIVIIIITGIIVSLCGYYFI